MKAHYTSFTLHFKQPAGTSRGTLLEKQSWIIKLEQDERIGIGECGILKGLSADDRPGYEAKLSEVCAKPDYFVENLDRLAEWPSIQAGLEMAAMDLRAKQPFILFENSFSTGEAGIPINGLIWMGDRDFMKDQIRTKLKAGFDCLKMKIGAIDFNTELDILKSIRQVAGSEDLVLRVDANGAFSPEQAMSKLDKLSRFDIHSIEQPIKQGQWSEMAALCKESPLPIALDEELIGVIDYALRADLLDSIKPPFIILKPSFIGGFRGSDHWIELAENRGIGWWATSALESNIGLNAISQWTASKGVKMHQGLGTGQLYTNNFDSPLEVEAGAPWNIKGLEKEQWK
jgi:o-succinylbenzoate synthase